MRDPLPLGRFETCIPEPGDNGRVKTGQTYRPGMGLIRLLRQFLEQLPESRHLRADVIAPSARVPQFNAHRGANH